MTVIQKLDSWLIKILRHKSDTPETLEQKVYLVRNGIIASLIITVLVYIPMIIFRKFQFLLITSPLVVVILITDGLLIIIKRWVKWFFYFYYGSYIIICTLIVLAAGGLPYSMGAWGGAFIVFMHALAIRDKRILVVNAFIYFSGLVVIAVSYPFLSLMKQWTPEFNNLLFTIDEIWMCLFLVKAFYDSIVVRTNEAKRKAEHLQELDVLKSKLYANIAHEFRTPLTLIRGNAEEIVEHHEGEVSDKATSIIQSSDKILFLVNQMLNLSKIEEGGVPMHYVQGDLVAFIRLITGSFQGYADLHKISLHFNSKVPQLMMDIEAEKLEESLSNLLSNAIKYTPAGGEVHVSVRMPESGKSSERAVEIVVRDTGIGIPEDQLEKIFIRFYRVENERYPYGEGSGIGLTLVKEYLRMMKGSISVKSSSGCGSEFVLTLPVTQNVAIEDIIAQKAASLGENDSSISLPEAISSGSGCPRLLIVEDNQEMMEYLTGLLANQYQIFTAANGIIGVKEAMEKIPDIILSDIMMPGKDGYQVCRELKNDFRTNHIPVVLLTARADTDSRIKGMEAGADAYLTKPFNKKELKVCLNNLFVQRETLRLKFSMNVFDRKKGRKEMGLNERFLAKVISSLEENYRNDRYGINNLYSDIGISRVQLHRKLTALTGLSASGFIRNFRLQKARNLLLETNQNVSDIAYAVGFGDANYFSKVFVLEYGLTATELRKSFR